MSRLLVKWPPGVDVGRRNVPFRSWRSVVASDSTKIFLLPGVAGGDLGSEAAVPRTRRYVDPSYSTTGNREKARDPTTLGASLRLLSAWLGSCFTHDISRAAAMLPR